MWLVEFEVKRRKSDDADETKTNKGNKKYKDMIKRYEYLPVMVKTTENGFPKDEYLFKNLAELFQEDVTKTFEKVLVHLNNSQFKFLILDSEGSFTQLDRKLNFDTIISLRDYIANRPTLKSENKEVAQKITSFNKQSTSLIFTFENNIGFLKIKTAQKGQKTNLKS